MIQQTLADCYRVVLHHHTDMLITAIKMAITPISCWANISPTYFLREDGLLYVGIRMVSLAKALEQH